MQLTINISKTHARALAALLLILIIGAVANSAGAAMTQWHPLSEISANGGVSSIESTTAPGKINASYIDGGASQWITSGSNIYYDAGNVGIGTTNPARKLHVTGNGISISSDAVDRGSIYWDTANSRMVIKVN